MPRCESWCWKRSSISSARALTISSGRSTSAASAAACDRGLAELGLRPAARAPRARRSAISLAKLVERVELGGVGGEVVVELGQLLLADLLDGDREVGRLAGQVLRAGGPRGSVSSTSSSSPGEAPRSASSISGSSRPAPSSTIRSSRGAAVERARRRPCPRSRSTTRSPSGGPRSTGLTLANPSRSRSSSASMASSGTSASAARPTSRPRVVAELRLRAHADLDRERELLALGGELRDVELRDRRPADRRRRAGRRSYHSPSESRSACSRTASRPTRWITSAPGTLPLRNPGIRISRPMRAAAVRSTALRDRLGPRRDVDAHADSPSSVTEVCIAAQGTGSVLALRLARRAAPQRDRELGEEPEDAADGTGDEPGAAAGRARGWPLTVLDPLREARRPGRPRPPGRARLVEREAARSARSSRRWRSSDLARGAEEEPDDHAERDQASPSPIMIAPAIP